MQWIIGPIELIVRMVGPMSEREMADITVSIEYSEWPILLISVRERVFIGVQKLTE